MNEATQLRVLLSELVAVVAVAKYAEDVRQSEAFVAASKAALPSPSRKGPIVLGIAGSAAFALIGPDLQSGEAAFVGVRDGMAPLKERQARAASMALIELRQRIGRPNEPYIYGPSHPLYKEPLDGPQEV